MIKETLKNQPKLYIIIIKNKIVQCVPQRIIIQRHHLNKIIILSVHAIREGKEIHINFQEISTLFA